MVARQEMLWQYIDYFTTLGKDLADAQAQKDALAAAIEPILA